MEALDVVKRMVEDGCISQEVAEKYCPEIKKYNDEIIKKQILNLIRQHSVNGDRCMMAKWVCTHARSLSPFKPSEEQMKALNYYLKYFIDKDGAFGSQLVKLYHDLLKLRNE